MTVVATDKTQLNKFKYHEKPWKHRMNTMVRLVEKRVDIPRYACAIRERGNFLKRNVSVTRMNVASCETPKAFRPDVSGVGLLRNMH